jgi:membrane peptidoglycan carboxypeptidase
MSVEKRDQKTGKFKPFQKEKKGGDKQVFDANVVANIDQVLKDIPGHNGRALKNGRPAIGKTGTWEYKDGETGENGDAWMVGATRQIAAAVWVGNYDKKNNPMPIKLAGGDRDMTGGSVPGQLWKLFMDAANKDTDVKSFPAPSSKVGSPDKKGNGLEPPPPPPQQEQPPQQNCLLGVICPPGQGNGNNGGGNGNGQGNGNNNGGGTDNGGVTPPAPPGQGQQPGTTLPGFPGGQNDGTDQGGGQNNEEDD